MTSYQRLRLLLTSALDSNQKLVGIALSDHMSDTRGYALCGVARLARLTSLSERTVQRVLMQGDGKWLRRDIKPGAKQYPTVILWNNLPKQEETGDSESPVPDSHPCQPDTPDTLSPVTASQGRGDSLTPEGCQPVHSGVTACHPKPTIKPTIEANQGSQPEYMSPPPAAPLFAQPPAAAPEPTTPPKPEPKGDTLTPGEMAVWQAYRLHHPTAKATPPKAHQGLLRAAVAEHGAEAVVSVIRWAHQSDHKQAAFLRDGGYTGLDNLLRKEKLPGRIELAAKEAAGDVHAPKLSALPPGMKPRGVVIDADSGRVEVEEGPRNQPTGSKKLDLMVSAAERLQRLREQEEEEERQQQEVQNAEV